MAARAAAGDVPQNSGPLLLYAVKQVELAIRAHLDDLLRPAGVTALQYTALTVLDRRDGLTSAELARNSFVTPQAMRDLVTALESRGLITRDHDPEHRRRLLITLTPAGQALLRDTDTDVRALEQRMLSGLSAAERRAFRDYLNRARTALAGGPAH
ncbi:MarR family transcriptional regulator [Streptomycetaceae bacterium NBC_01309]